MPLPRKDHVRKAGASVYLYATLRLLTARSEFSLTHAHTPPPLRRRPAPLCPYTHACTVPSRLGGGRFESELAEASLRVQGLRSQMDQRLACDANFRVVAGRLEACHEGGSSYGDFFVVCIGESKFRNYRSSSEPASQARSSPPDRRVSEMS